MSTKKERKRASGKFGGGGGDLIISLGGLSVGSTVFWNSVSFLGEPDFGGRGKQGLAVGREKEGDAVGDIQNPASLLLFVCTIAVRRIPNE